MFEGLKKTLGLDRNERTLKRYSSVVSKINSLEPEMQGLSDEDLASLGVRFRDRVKNGETLDGLLPEVFAAVREVSRRTLGLRHFDVQLMAAWPCTRGRSQR
jgi:preprotein translocase subunit SecA